MSLMKPSIRRKIAFGYLTIILMVIGVSVVTLAEMEYVKQKMLFGGAVHAFLDTINELKRFEKNYLLYERRADYPEIVRYIDQADDLLGIKSNRFDAIASFDQIKNLQSLLHQYRDFLAQFTSLLDRRTSLMSPADEARKGMIEFRLRTVGDAIMRPLVLLGGLGGEQARKRAEELLQAVSLPVSYFERLPNELSGGEKQRVAIARAFAAEPELILCDEPISSLDVSVQGALMNLLMRLQAEQETSYVFISHDLSAVQHLSDVIAVVYLGHVMEVGDATTVLTPPFHPYTEALLSAVPFADPDAKQKPIRLGGSVPSAMHVPSGCRFHPRCPRCLGDICREQEPPWREGPGNHRIYCHIPLEELAWLQAETLVLDAQERA